MKILVLAAHPDDECLGVGPLILQSIADGHSVDVMCFTENSVRHGKAGASLESFRKSCQLLGVGTGFRYLGYPDQQLDQQVFTDLVGEIEAYLEILEPDMVLTHSQFDLNRDHRVVCEATRVAVRGRQIGMVAQYQSLSSSEHEFGGQFVMNCAIPVSHGEVARTWQIFADCYPDEVCDFPHPRSALGLRNWMGRAGANVRAEFAVPLHIEMFRGLPGSAW